MGIDKSCDPTTVRQETQGVVVKGIAQWQSNLYNGPEYSHPRGALIRGTAEYAKVFRSNGAERFSVSWQCLPRHTWSCTLGASLFLGFCTALLSDFCAPGARIPHGK